MLLERSGSGRAAGAWPGCPQGRFTAITTKDGLSSNVVRSLYADQQGSVWIGTLGGGLNRLKNGRITVYMTRHGLFDDVIWLILEDGQRQSLDEQFRAGSFGSANRT